MPVTPDRAGPYAPAKVIIDLIERYRSKGLPKPITSEVLARAGVPESVMARSLQALVTLDLIDADGQPTAAFDGMRIAPEGEYRSRMAEWLTSAYADALQFVDPASATETDIRDAFRHYKPIGQQPRMVILFMGLFRHAGLAPDKAPTGGAAPRKKASVAAPKVKVDKPRVPKPADPKHEDRKPTDNKPPTDYRTALLAKFPDFDPAWNDEIKAKWFAGFDTFMKGVEK